MTVSSSPSLRLRQNRGRIDHIAFIARPENFTAMAERIATVLDLDFDGPYDNVELGLRVIIDWHAGIELLTPCDPELATIQTAYLDKYGEGFYRLVFGVADLDSALKRVTDNGLQVGVRMNGLKLNPGWTALFDRIDEVSVEKPAPGFYLTLGQIEPSTNRDEGDCRSTPT